jgi:beta-lactamase regulating signal transducer with metallopeptidase domain
MGMIQLALRLVLRAMMPFIEIVVDKMTARCQERIYFAIPIAPRVVALVCALLVVAPQYIRKETNPLQERVGTTCVIGALAVAMLYLYGIFRTAQLLFRERRLRISDSSSIVLTGGMQVHVIEHTQPLLAVTGILAPRIVISKHLLDNAEFSQDSLQIALAHENSHVFHRDNLKHLVLASLSFPRSERQRQLRRWRYAAEIAADDDAVGGNSSRAILLAETLLVAARTIPQPRTSALSLGLRPHEEELNKRIDRLLRDDSTIAPTMRLAEGHFVLATALALGGICVLSQIFITSIHSICEYLLHFG